MTKPIGAVKELKKNERKKIMPPLVVMLISAIVCGLLVLANSATKDKIVKAQEEKIQ